MSSFRSVAVGAIGLFLVLPAVAGARGALGTMGRFVLYGAVVLFLCSAIMTTLTDRRLNSTWHFTRGIALALGALVVWALVRASSLRALEQSVMLAGLGGFWLAVVYLEVKKREIVRIAVVGTLVGSGIAAAFLFAPAAFAHPNYPAGILVIYSFFPFVLMSCWRSSVRVLPILALGFFCLAILQSRSRASALGMSLMVAVWIVLNTATIRYRDASLKTVVVAVFGGIALVLAVVYWSRGLVFDLAVISQLNPFSEQIFGKPLTTGRQQLWSVVVPVIRDRLWTGWGSGTRVSDFMDVTLSAHNLYLQVWLQWGIVGLVLLFSLLATLVRTLFRPRLPLSNLVIVVILAAMVRDLFEVTLLQNNAPLTASLWLIIGLGCSYSLRQSRGASTPPLHSVLRPKGRPCSP